MSQFNPSSSETSSTSFPKMSSGMKTPKKSFTRCSRYLMRRRVEVERKFLTTLSSICPDDVDMTIGALAAELITDSPAAVHGQEIWQRGEPQQWFGSPAPKIDDRSEQVDADSRL